MARFVAILSRVAALCAVWGCLLPSAAWAAPVREADLLGFIGEQVALRQQADPKRVEVHWNGPSLASLMGSRPLPEGTARFAIVGTPRLLGRTAVPISIEIDGKKLKTVYPRVEIKVWQDVWVSTETLHRGRLFAPSLGRAERRSLETVMGAPATSLSTLEGAVVKREVPAGAVLVNEMFDLPALVKTGKEVTVKLVSGELVIVTRAQAVADGTMGQLVRVFNPDSRKDYVARVTGIDQVEVRLEEAP
ncbi:MAG TPA: flagellar basal body P-ring formation chaperone FlgA [Pantanalinema sp.]